MKSHTVQVLNALAFGSNGFRSKLRASCLAAVRGLLRDRSRSLLLPAAALLELSGS